MEELSLSDEVALLLAMGLKLVFWEGLSDAVSDAEEESELLVLVVRVELLLELELGVMKGLLVPLVLGELVALGLEDKLMLDRKSVV